MPILDAFAQRRAQDPLSSSGARRGRRGQHGRCLCARLRRPGRCITSTGTAAGNAGGAMVEALTAGTPLLHITGPDRDALPRQRHRVHPRGAGPARMLKAVSKAAFRVRSVETALGTLREAVRVALTAPSGPVSVEIPIDIQAAEIDWPADLAPLPITLPQPHAGALDALAEQLAQSEASAAVARRRRASCRRRGRSAWSTLGFGVVTSVQGRGERARRSSGVARRVQRPQAGREASTRPATRCWWSARVCAATKR